MGELASGPRRRLRQRDKAEEGYSSGQAQHRRHSSRHSHFMTSSGMPIELHSFQRRLRY
jgi:hypothetical protein